MRPLEIVLIGLDTLYLLFRLLPGSHPIRYLQALPGLATLAMVAHWIIESPRWQMVPLYALTLILLALAIWGWRTHQVSVFRKPALWSGLAIGLVALFSLPGILFPVPHLLAPTGPYQVGTHTFYWVDQNRVETLAPVSTPPGQRELMVQVWYPAEPWPDMQPGPYMDDLQIVGKAIARQFHLPSFLLGHLGLARSHSYLDAPLAKTDQPFPVLIFSHGWTGYRTQNTYQMEELASHGYVVFAPDHTYGAGVTVFPDGRIALNNPNLLPSNVSQETYDQAARKLGEAWVGDLRFVLDQVEALNAHRIHSPFPGRLDLSRIGVFGHSTGGGAAVETCWVDPRCKAGLSEDAWLIPYSREMVSQGFAKPWMLLQSEKWTAARNPKLVKELYGHLHQNDRYQLTIAGTQHYDFTDVSLFTPLAASLRIKGPIDGSRDLRLINAYTLAFFNRYLQGSDEPLLSGSSAEYPEVNWAQ